MVAVESAVVLDASVIGDILAPDISSSGPAVVALRALAERGTTFLGPRLLLHESSTMLLSGIRRQRWDGSAADRAASRLARLPITIVDDPHDSVRAWELARRYDNHPIYDMVYVAMAERLGVPLLTQDERLLRRVVDLDWVLSPADVR